MPMYWLRTAESRLIIQRDIFGESALPLGTVKIARKASRHEPVRAVSLQWHTIVTTTTSETSFVIQATGV